MAKKLYILPFIVLLYLEQLKGQLNHNEQETLADVINNKRYDYTPAPPKLTPYKNICTQDKAVCVLPVQCPAHFKTKQMKLCNVIGGRHGICCVSGQNHTCK